METPSATNNVVQCPSEFYLLFFDGGSRGNPGPGGSGSIILRSGANNAGFTVCWLAQKSYASKTTTNNVAENMGLLTGLRACVRHGYSPVHVIGIHRRRKPPKASHIKNIYWRSRRLADQLQVIQWHHHLRCYNKMADKLANQAMNSKRSIQVRIAGTTLQLQRWAAVLQHQHGDVIHWADNDGTTMRDSIVDKSQAALMVDSMGLTTGNGGE
ncbi:Hypothetical protein PHPALM_4187 [Phytophthora palmivora]|uniref:RNase H type-1 domain-containing protein n=1 Tax=Phytophthora palmivora TaxID=4796 RepID=A0A2P4YKF8_9STRA|nr:Hypothetical protein PHPALM_4187 [Phytophthora palmivora]